jgi:hypothetical protein
MVRVRVRVRVRVPLEVAIQLPCYVEPPQQLAMVSKWTLPNKMHVIEPHA